jgi:hypothetical protein
MTLPWPAYGIAQLRRVQKIKSGMVTARFIEDGHRVCGLEPLEIIGCSTAKWSKEAAYVNY